MKLTKEQIALYDEACKTLLYDDLYAFVLSFWPDQVDTSKRGFIRYEEMKGRIDGLEEFDYHQELFEEFEIGNLLVHLDYSLKIAVHKSGLILNVVRPKEINKLYVKFLFEDKSIGYVIEDSFEKIPQGIRENLDSIYDIELVKEYFRRKSK